MPSDEQHNERMWRKADGLVARADEVIPMKIRELVDKSIHSGGTIDDTPLGPGITFIVENGIQAAIGRFGYKAVDALVRDALEIMQDVAARYSVAEARDDLRN